MSGICGWVGEAEPGVLDAMLSAIEIGLDYLYIEGLLYQIPPATATTQTFIDQQRREQTDAVDERYEHLKNTFFTRDELERYTQWIA